MSGTAQETHALALAPDSAAPGPLEARPAPRLHFIDGLRGLAMLMVLLYHCWLFGGMWSVGLTAGARHFNAAPVLGFGHVGVNLFLVLSGFCLYWPFVKGGRRREPTLWEFAKKRCRRILPPYYVTLILFSVVPLTQAWLHHTGSDAHYTLNWLFLHALMLHNTRPDYVLSVNGSLWSLALEFQLYILFPVLVEAYRRFNARGVVLAVLLVCTAYRFFLVRGHYLPDDGYGYVLAYSVFGRGFEFAVGMFAALLVARRHAEQKSPERWVDGLLLVAITLLAILDGRHGHFQTLTDAMWGLLFAALLLAGSRSETRLHRALSHPLLVWLGLFSYSVYLIHLPMVMVLGTYGHARFSNTAQVLFMLLFVAPLMVGLGYLFHLLFERPFMNVPRDTDARRVRKPAPQAAHFRLRRPPPAPPAAAGAGTPEDAGSSSDLSPSDLSPEANPSIIRGGRGYDRL